MSHGWWICFCGRWPQLRLHQGDSFPIVRNQATDYAVFKDYFDLQGETLTKYGIKDKSAQIYNCDELGMQLEYKMPKLLQLRVQRRYSSVILAQKLR